MARKPTKAKAKTAAKKPAKASAEKRLRELGIQLPNVPKPVANYVPFVKTGKLVYVSGQGPRRTDGTMAAGKVGGDVTVEQAYQDARLVGLSLLAVLREATGNLDKVKRIVKLLGMVNGVAEFDRQPEVINGCSDLLVDVFGDRGRHARSAVGMGSLPRNITVEIELIAEVA